MKKYIDKTEWYPVYTIENISSIYKSSYNIPFELFERYERVLEEFNDVQVELRNIYNSHNPFDDGQY